MLGLDLHYSSVYNPQTDSNIYRSTYNWDLNLTGRNLVALVKKVFMEFVPTMKLTEFDQIRKSSGDFYLI